MMKILFLLSYVLATMAETGTFVPCLKYKVDIKQSFFPNTQKTKNFYKKRLWLTRLENSGYVWPNPAENAGVNVDRETAKSLCEKIGLQTLNISTFPQKEALEIDLKAAGMNGAIYGIMGITESGKRQVTDRYANGRCQNLILVKNQNITRRSFRCNEFVTPICQFKQKTRCYEEHLRLLNATTVSLKKEEEEKKASALKSTPRSNYKTTIPKNQLTGDIKVATEQTVEHQFWTVVEAILTCIFIILIMIYVYKNPEKIFATGVQPFSARGDIDMATLPFYVNR